MHRKSDHLKKIEGTYRSDRSTKKTQEGLEVLEKLPRAPKLFNLNGQAKKWYMLLGKILLQSGKLTKLDIPNLVLFANRFSTWEWAKKEVDKKNDVDPGSGYVQEFQSGARGRSPEYSIQLECEKFLVQMGQMFGMSFKDRAQINHFFEENSDQLDLFEQLLGNGTSGPQSSLTVIGED